MTVPVYTNSWTISTKLPPIRRDIQFHPYKHGKEEWYLVHDAMGYVQEHLLVHPLARLLSPMLHGMSSAKEIYNQLKEIGIVDEGVLSPELILEYCTKLDADRLLYSTYFKQYKAWVEEDFEQQTLRQPVCVGTSYPQAAADIKHQFQSLHSTPIPPEWAIQTPNIKALFAPHIDPRVSGEAYIKAFSALRERPFRRVVILGTSHYAGLYHPLYENVPFIASRKSYCTPLGEVHTDQQWIDTLQTRLNGSFTVQDRAHRIEHSIELHVLFLQLVAQQPFTIVPILVNSFEELLYTPHARLHEKVRLFSATLWELLNEDEHTILCMSGDLAHIGLKFGDEQAAATMLNDVQMFDQGLLDAAENIQPEQLLHILHSNLDAYRICGFAPMYAGLLAASILTGVKTSYERWDEQETDSAVTFGSVLYFSKNNLL